MNNFQISTKLGEGAYSTVYKVRRFVDGNIYALKKVKLINLSEKERENSLNEVRLLASIKSRFVISYKEAFFDEKDNTLCMVMEFADSGDLYQKIIESRKRQRLFEESDIWRIFIQLVKGLKALHELNILHRDLKSANVFLMRDGSVKLGDLNVSKVQRKGMGYTQTGTPYYASPEVWDDKPYDTKSDIWSLGCVLYEMITLRPPFRAKNMEGLYKKVIQGRFNRIPNQFTNDLFKIVQLLLQVNPEKRPSCSEILNNPIVLKRIEFFKNYSGEDCTEDQALLKTILVPKNLLFLSNNLPKPNYGNKSVNCKRINMRSNSNENYKIFNSDKKLIQDDLKNNDYIIEKIQEREGNLKGNNDIINNYNKKEKKIKNQLEIINRSINSKKIIEKVNVRNNLMIKKNIAKSVSKIELPTLKQIKIKNENLKDINKNNNNNMIPFSCKSDNNIRKKNNNIFDILNKKNIIGINQVNILQKPSINIFRNNCKNNAIININSKIANNRGSKSIELYRENGYYIPNKKKLIPIKKI